MADNSKINVDQLNFDGIKTNLKNFLSGQTQFKDYDFDGSNLSVLVDLLAYNTYYNNIYNNLAINEMFLESASKRNSAVSLAKMLGYQPKSIRSSKANVDLVVSFPTSSESPDQLIIPRYTKFSSFVNNNNYYFVTLDERSAFINDSGQYVFSGVQLTEGKLAREKYIVSPGNTFAINNSNCDTSTLRVYVSDSSGVADAVVYSLADNISNVGPTSTVYFLKEIDNGLYQIEFGNGAIGKKLSNGNVVTIEYIVSSGDASNGCKSFNPEIGSFTSGASVTVTTNRAAINGAAAETLEEIKFNAPRAYFSQNRAVTENDYQNVIYTNFDNAKSINVWGGEQNEPPVYGKVFISIVPKTGEYLSDDEKLQVRDIIRSKSMVTVHAEIVDPTYLNIEVDTIVYYSSNATTKSASAISDMVRNTISTYSDGDLKKFGGIFRYSKLSRLIDSTEKSIQSNITTIKLRREVQPRFNVNAQYVVNIGNPIYNVTESFVSTGFYMPESGDRIFYLRDDASGRVMLYYVDAGGEVIVNSSIGTVDYAKGIITVKGLNISSIDGTIWEFIVRPESYDVIGLRNQIIDIPTTKINVSTIVDPVSTGRGTGSYVFTSSRS